MIETIKQPHKFKTDILMVTLKDVARELGLSTGTVSMALNNSPRISAETARQVRAAVRALEYTPNHFGRGLRSGKSRLIGYFSNHLNASFFAEIFQGAGEKLAEHDYGILSCWPAQNSAGGISRNLDMMLGKNVDGIIFVGGDWLLLGEEAFRMLNDRRIPFVFCSRYCADYHVPFIVTDDLLGGELAANCLLERGHRVILCESNDSIERRMRGNFNAINRYSDAKSVVFYQLEEVPALVRKHHATAVLTFSDQHAFDVMNLLRRNGLRVPEDVSVVGYDDIEYAARPEFSLTTIRQQRKKLGELVATYLLERLDGRTPEPEQLLAPELVVRGSVRSLP